LDYLVVKEKASFFAEVRQVFTSEWFDSVRNPFLLWFCGLCSYFVNARKRIYAPLKHANRRFLQALLTQFLVFCYVSVFYSTKKTKNKVLIILFVIAFRCVLGWNVLQITLLFPCDKLNCLR
jgi:cellulose synthase/poly-beta-1,6-N-acetylglucosamine synthase-like glycosyltransferase